MRKQSQNWPGKERNDRNFKAFTPKNYYLKNKKIADLLPLKAKGLVAYFLRFKRKIAF